MPSFADSIFLFLLALLLFGPKKLPVLARELGKWMGEFRRASNEFKMQMEEELRVSEQTERQKQIAAMEAAAPIPPALEEPEIHPHLRHAAPPATSETSAAEPSEETAVPIPALESESVEVAEAVQEPEPMVAPTADGSRPIPIASSGNLHMMPPPTGLPVARGRATAASNGASPLAGLVEAIPVAHEGATEPHGSSHDSEGMAHGD